MATTAPQENVADYPRPPRLEPTPRHLRVLLDGAVVADTYKAYRVCETYHPPTYYIPKEDCDASVITPSPGGHTLCEWKGRASYFDVQVPSGNGTKTVHSRVWSYENPTPDFKPIAGYYSFYASPFECFVDDEKVVAQPGDFYGGWKTDDIIGPIKGAPGTRGW